VTRISYIGIDETTLGIGSDSALVVAAETTNSLLRQDCGFGSLEKARDYLVQGKSFPTIEEMPGLEMFHWTRVRGGRFPKLILEHAGIAHLVASNGYRPASTVLLIDRFHAHDSESHFLIKEYLHAHGFPIPDKNIELIGGADKRIPIVNYADLIAFQIGLQLEERYQQFHTKKTKFMLKPYHVPFDVRRTMPLPAEARDQFETLLRRYRGADAYDARTVTRVEHVPGVIAENIDGAVLPLN
jgi:hypothetical protein